MIVYITKDNKIKAFYGKKPKLNMEALNEDYFWEIPYEERDGENCGYDIISQSGTYYFSDVLLELFNHVGEQIKWNDEPKMYNLTANEIINL